jgi:hypothetical protein
MLSASRFCIGLPNLALADGEYWGFDISESTTGGVLSASRGELIFGAA